MSSHSLHFTKASGGAVSCRVLSNSFWSFSNISDTVWNFINVAYFFFRSLVEPLISIGGNQESSRNRNSRGHPGPPRPPRRGFRTFSGTIDSPGNFPMAGG